MKFEEDNNNEKMNLNTPDVPVKAKAHIEEDVNYNKKNCNLNKNNDDENNNSIKNYNNKGNMLTSPNNPKGTIVKTSENNVVGNNLAFSFANPITKNSNKMDISNLVSIYFFL